MNRAQRRALARGKVQQERVVPLPAMLDEFTIFGPLDNLLHQIGNGDISINEDDKPIFLGPSGTWTEVIPALQGWVFTWNRIAPEIDLSALKTIIESLTAGEMLTRAQLIEAETALVALKKYFRTHDRAEIQSRAKTAQIAIFLGTDN